MTTEQSLRAALAQHGFHTAAKDLRIREVENPAETLAQWENYPSCMNVWVKTFRKKRTWPTLEKR